MPFLRTRKATGWPTDLGKSAVGKILTIFIPQANPDYTAKMHLVYEWLIEFDDEGNPWREIGIDADGKPVLAGPDARNYGFWLDTNAQIKDFNDGVPVDKEIFEKLWRETGVHEPN